jgi:hypothetical protein
MRIRLAGIIFKVSRISRVGSEDEHCHMPQRSQGMSLLSITSLGSGGRGGRSTEPASSGVLPIAASIWRVNSSPKGLKIAVRCVVIGSIYLRLPFFRLFLVNNFPMIDVAHISSKPHTVNRKRLDF